MSIIYELCRGLNETNKSQHYHLIDRLIHLVLSLPVSTAITYLCREAKPKTLAMKMLSWSTDALCSASSCFSLSLSESAWCWSLMTKTMAKVCWIAKATFSPSPFLSMLYAPVVSFLFLFVLLSLFILWFVSSVHSLLVSCSCPPCLYWKEMVAEGRFGWGAPVVAASMKKSGKSRMLELRSTLADDHGFELKDSHG